MNIMQAQIIATTAALALGAAALADPEYQVVSTGVGFGVGGAEGGCGAYYGDPSSAPQSWEGYFCCPDGEGGCATFFYTDIPKAEGGGAAAVSASGHSYGLWVQCGPTCNSQGAVGALMEGRLRSTFDDIVFVSDSNETITVNLRLRINANMLNSGSNLIKVDSSGSGSVTYVTSNMPAGWVDGEDFIVTLPGRVVSTNQPTTWNIGSRLQTKASCSIGSPVAAAVDGVITLPPSTASPAGLEPVFIVPEGVTVMSAQAGIENNTWFAPPAACATDFDNDGMTGASDLATLLSGWGDCPGCAADLNGDGAVDAGDLAALLAAWGPCNG